MILFFLKPNKAIELLMLAVFLLLLRDNWLPASSQVSEYMNKFGILGKILAAKRDVEPSQHTSYEEWVARLRREAEAAARQHPKNLSIIAGDSLTMWFPRDLLPPDKTWLNQGISGETSAGLLKRLNLFDKTQPEVIFVMIGINDLCRGVAEETVLTNHRQILSHLRRVHAQSQKVLQSILPHSGMNGCAYLFPNSRIREINRQLEAIAAQEGAQYLDLYPLFADASGNLRPELSTDGLHLSASGYLVWRSALAGFQASQSSESNISPKATQTPQ